MRPACTGFGRGDLTSWWLFNMMKDSQEFPRKIVSACPTERVTWIVDNRLAAPMFALRGAGFLKPYVRGDENKT
jgi:hypothetical protein